MVEFRSEWARKALHLPAFLVPLGVSYHRGLTIMALAVVILFYVIIELKPVSWSWIIPLRGFFQQFKRSDSIDYAPLYMAVSFLCGAIVFSVEALFYAAYIMAFADTAAALVGKKWGRHQIKNTQKTFEGSLAFCLTAMFGAFFFVPLTKMILASFLLTIAEAYLDKGRDNLVLPLLSAVCL